MARRLDEEAPYPRVFSSVFLLMGEAQPPMLWPDRGSSGLIFCVVACVLKDVCRVDASGSVPLRLLRVLGGFCLTEDDIWLWRLTDGWSTDLGVELLGEQGGSGADGG